MFDKLLLISEGYPVYYGKARESMEYFSSLGFIPEIAMNPAEFLLDLATGQVTDISVPEALSASQGASDSEVLKVRTNLHLIFLPISSILSSYNLFHFVLVSSTQIQNSAGAKRKGRTSSKQEDS